MHPRDNYAPLPDGTVGNEPVVEVKTTPAVEAKTPMAEIKTPATEVKEPGAAEQKSSPRQRENDELKEIIAKITSEFWVADKAKKRLMELKEPLACHVVKRELESISNECKEILNRPVMAATQLGWIASLSTTTAGLFCLCFGNALAGGALMVGGVTGVRLSDDGYSIYDLTNNLAREGLDNIRKLEEKFEAERQTRHRELQTPASVATSPFALLRSPPTPPQALPVGEVQVSNSLRSLP